MRSFNSPSFIKHASRGLEKGEVAGPTKKCPDCKQWVSTYKCYDSKTGRLVYWCYVEHNENSGFGWHCVGSNDDVED